MQAPGRERRGQQRQLGLPGQGGCQTSLRRDERGRVGVRQRYGQAVATVA